MPAVVNPSSLDISLDNNDVYDVVLLDATEKRLKALRLGPNPSNGLHRFNETLHWDSPNNIVSIISVTPISGDSNYALGHVFLR